MEEDEIEEYCGIDVDGLEMLMEEVGKIDVEGI